MPSLADNESSSGTTTSGKNHNIAGAGLPGAHPAVEQTLRDVGVDPDRLSIRYLGSRATFRLLPAWAWRMLLGFGLLLITEIQPLALPEWLEALLALAVGLIILQATCQVLIVATERLAARFKWNHYVAGTLAEILSTLPELVVIAFIIPVSPVTAFIVTVITIYNNALVFSLYSFFLPRDEQGKFLMPTPITEAGTQILVGGAAMGLILGLVMLTFTAANEGKTSFTAFDLTFISVILLAMFTVYIYKLVTSYSREEAQVREALDMSDADVEKRIDSVYRDVEESSFASIGALFVLAVLGAWLGGEQVSAFAVSMIRDLDINPIVTALVLAGFAGMSEYVILWQAHRRQEYGIALANAFGGITQVMFLVLPFTLLGIAFFQLTSAGAHPELPLAFTLTGIFLLIFLFPTFYTLISLIEEDHTLGVLDTTIMSGIFVFLIVLLAVYAGGAVPGG